MNFHRPSKSPRDPLNRAFYLPRLPREHYQADAVVFWTLTVFDQVKDMAFLRTYLEPELSPAKFQPQPQDEVLRTEQRKRNAFVKVCFYIAANPVRAKLNGEKEVWPFIGCIIPGYPKLNPLADDYWSKFWRIFAKLRQPDAGNIKRPPIG